MRSAIDTNIAVYAFADRSDLHKTRVAGSIVEELALKDECVVSTQVIKEFANVCLRRMRPAMSRETLLSRLSFLGELDVVNVDPVLVRAAVDRHFVSQLNFYDALIIEAAIAGGAEVLYSEDLQHGMTFGSLRVVNPFLE